jgi:xanthine dehydrogenase accessory factor
MMLEIYREIIRIQEEGGVAALATVVCTEGSTPREVGAKMLIKSNGTTMGSIGGGIVEDEVNREAMEIMTQGKPKVLHFDLTGKGPADMICGGIMDVFIEPVQCQPLLYLFGAGHISVPLVKIGKMLGFRVVVVDDRPDLANAERLPETDMLLCEDFKTALPKLEIGSSGYVVIATRTHQTDELVLDLILKTSAKYIGMLASRKKRESIFSHLLAKGIPQDLLDRVHSPIGLEIQAETPEEIAISILAEMIKVRRS